MERRKFLIGVGSLTAASAAAMGTGAFTSVSANREMVVKTKDDNDALLAIESTGSDNADEYVDDSGDAVRIDIESDDGGKGVNDDAYTIIRDLLKITNQGSQEVYVWFEGVPDGVSIFHDDGDFPKGESGGDYTGNLNEPGTGRFQPDDPDASESSNYFKLPDLGPGDSLDEIGLSVNTNDGEVDFDGDITVVAKTLDEAES